MLKVDPQRAATFPLALRIPAWCTSPQISINGKAVDGATAGTFFRLSRDWKYGDVVILNFPMALRASMWVNHSTGIERGPLAFSLKINEEWKKKREYMQDFDEFEVLPQSSWNYALQTDRTTLTNITVRTQPVPAVPFSTDAPPVVLTVPARRLPAWGLRTMNGTVTLGRADKGWQALASAPTPLEAGKAHRVRVEAKGSSLRVFVDDFEKPVIQHEDDAIATGGIGLRTYGTAARFDDVMLDGKPVADFEHGAVDWQTFGGKWAVRDGMYAADAARDGKAVLNGRDDLHDFTLEATVTADTGGDAGLMFRVTNATNELDGYRGYYVGLTPRKQQSQDAAEPPVSPVTSSEPLEKVELIPFGSAKLRVSYFPVLRSETKD